MRSLLLLLVIMIVTPTALVMPQIGVLVWSWMSIMNPHRLSWGMSFDAPYVLMIACVTLVAWAISREPKTPPSHLFTWAVVLFVFHTTLTTYTSLHPEISWPLWERNLKTFVLVIVAATLIRSKVRIQSLLWIIAVSLGFFAANGVENTLSTGGKVVLTGPRETMLADNNHMALSLAIILPILNYLRVSSANRLVKLALLMVFVFALISILTSYSRGAFIALIFGTLFFLRSARGRATLIVLLASVGVATFAFMPDELRARLTTLRSVESVQEDGSFAGRLDAWHVSWKLGQMRPLTGGGYSAVEHPATFLKFAPDSPRSRAAHSVYFQVLGDHGFLGLGIYLTMYLAAWQSLRRTRLRCDGQTNLVWAQQLATMLQISLIMFFVGAAAVSVAYHDLILLILVICMQLDVVSKRIMTKENELLLLNQEFRPQLQ